MNANISEQAHAAQIEEVLQELESPQDGLTREEAAARLETFGPNTLPKKKELHPVLRFLSHFNNILIYVLIGAGVVTALLGHWIDTWIILAVVVVNALIGCIQEGKAEKALQAVENMLSLHAHVMRDGDTRQIDAAKLVPGDIILLSAGDKVPSDARVIESAALQTNEASLTGESEPVSKQNEPSHMDASLGDRKSMVYSGTLVTSGQGRAVVTATGRHTELGKINTMLSEVEVLKTPLLRQVGQFGTRLTLVILALGVITLAGGYFIGGMDAVDLFMAVVGIAVASIPEGLPAIMTITLAVGVQRMASRHAIIRKLPGVETLGSVTVICSDKTGTLTKSEMTVTSLVLSDAAYRISGTGYAPEGSFTEVKDLSDEQGQETDPAQREQLMHLLSASVLCNDARLRDSSDGWTIEGSPTEGAFLTAAGKADIWLHDLHKHIPRTAVLPFSSDYKFMAVCSDLTSSSRTLPGAQGQESLMFVKGAPEVVFSRCASELASDGSSGTFNRSRWEQQARQLAETGHRVLAVARGKGTGKTGELTPDDVGKDLTILGIAGIIDPPREEAIAAVKTCREAGIRVKMITGDHGLTALAIAAQLGIGDGERVITGDQLQSMSDEEISREVLDTDVFARVTPEHKLRLVTALQNHGSITAMTGDGVNDAPALKKADIGIAMGIKGTEAAKEAAEMVLADDNFASIAHAVEEGRTVYDNLKKSLLFILPTNGGEAMIIIASILFGLVLPITPAQILWVNMVTAVTLALTLAFEPMETDVMKRPPRRTDESLVPPSLLLRILFVSLLLMGASLGLFAWFRAAGADIPTARTIAVNALVFGEIVYLFNSRLITASSISKKGFRATRYVWGAAAAVAVLQLLFTYLPVFHRLFDTAGISVFHWLMILLSGAAVFLAVELQKAVSRRRRNP